MTLRDPASDFDALLRRIRAEYKEMPGLHITFRQAQRLWALEGSTCLRALEALVASNFLLRTTTGQYVRQDSHESSIVRRPASTSARGFATSQLSADRYP